MMTGFQPRNRRIHHGVMPASVPSHRRAGKEATMMHQLLQGRSTLELMGLSQSSGRSRRLKGPLR